MKKIKNGSQGFTLLELLVVVLIIGILAAIALPQYKFAVAKSKFATLKNSTRALYDAEQRYYLQYSKYTSIKSDLDIEVKDNCSINLGTHDYVICSKEIIGSKELAYLLWLTSDAKDCMTFEVNNLNDVTHRVCQTESGKKIPTDCNNDNCQYIWK